MHLAIFFWIMQRWQYIWWNNLRNNLLFSFELCLSGILVGVILRCLLQSLAIFFWIMLSKGKKGVWGAVANKVQKLAIFFWIMRCHCHVAYESGNGNYLAIFFWIMLDTISHWFEYPQPRYMHIHVLLFSFELCIDEVVLLIADTIVDTLAIFFWIMLLSYSHLSRPGSNIACYFLLNYAWQVSTMPSASSASFLAIFFWIMPVHPSTPPCPVSTLSWACYFLLNYAYYRPTTY